MKPKDFLLEVFFEKYEFTAKYLLAQSDCETMTIGELLNMEEGSLESLMSERLGYTEVKGSPGLRKEIAKLYQNVDAKGVVVHSGAQEAIYNFMNLFLNEGDEVIVQYPTYQSLYEVAISIGCNVKMWNLREGEGTWEMDLEELSGLATENTKLLIINNPNNPTGYIFDADEMNKIVDIARKNDIFIFADEVYHGLESDGIRRPWFVDLYKKAASLGVMSKAYGLAGLRIGWLSLRDESLINGLSRMKHYTTISNSMPSEYLAKIALRHGEKLLDRNRKLIAENISYAAGFFKRHENIFEMNEPSAGPIGFHRLKEGSVTEFCDKLVNEHGILLLPSWTYDYGDSHFRMGYGRSDFRGNLDRLEAALK